MAIRFDDAADRIVRTTNVPTWEARTVCFWIYPLSVASESCLWSANRNNVSDSKELFELYQSKLYIDDGMSTAQGPTTLSDNTWYFVAEVRTAINGTLYGYLATVTGTVTQEISMASNATAQNTLNRMEMAQFTTNNYIRFDGRIAAIKLWQAALTLDELKAEKWSIVPRRVANLYGWWPGFPGATERLRDYGFNAYNWTETGTLTDEAGPPVAWGLWTPPQSIFQIAGGPPTVSVSSSVTLAETIAIILISLIVNTTVVTLSEDVTVEVSLVGEILGIYLSDENDNAMQPGVRIYGP